MKKYWLFAIHFCFFIILVYRLSELWGIPFICMDDMFIALDSLRHGGIWSASKAIAFGTGRFYQLIFYTLAQIPHQFHSLPITYIFRILSALPAFIAFWYLLRYLFQSPPFASFTVLLLALFLQGTSGYNSFHSLTLWFNLAWAFCLIGFCLYYLSVEKQRKTFLWLSAFSFFFGMMAYESLLLFGVIFPLIYYFLKQEIRTKKFINSMIPIALCYIFYIFVYIVFKMKVGANYEGTSLSLSSIHRIVSTVWKFTINGMILHFPSRHSISTSPLVYALSLLVFISSLFYFNNLPKIKISIRQHGFAIPILFLLSFTPNILYGFIERYRLWAAEGPIYHGNYFSAFFLSVTIALICHLLQHTPLSQYRRFTSLLLSCVITAIGFQSLRVNKNFFDEIRKTSVVWEYVDEDIGRGLLSHLAKDSILISDSLNNLYCLDPTVYQYWDFYFLDKLQLKTKVVKTEEGITLTQQVFKYELLPRRGISYLAHKTQSGVELLVSNHSDNAVEIPCSNCNPDKVFLQPRSIEKLHATAWPIVD